MSGAARRYRTGKLAPKHDARTFAFGSFLTPEIPAPPDEVDTLARFKRTLGWYGNYSSLMPMDLNDRLGDCVTGDALISGPRQVAAYKAPFRGNVIAFTLASGKRLTVTPNHHMLTDKGFVAAKFVQNGDNLISTRGAEIFPGGVSGSGQTNFDDRPAPAQQKFKASAFARTPVSKIMPVPIHFHGDGKFINGNIDVVTADRLLGSERDPSLSEPHSKDKVGPAGELQRLFERYRPAFKGAFILFRTSHRDIGTSRQRATFSNRHFGISQSDRLAERTQRMALLHDRSLKLASIDPARRLQRFYRFPGEISFNPLRQVSEIPSDCYHARCHGRTPFEASVVEPIGNIAPTDPKFAGDLIECLSGLVAADRVINIDTQFLTGSHVYDFSTDVQWYVANGIVTHNCTIAAKAHLATLWEGLAGRRVVAGDETVRDDYFRLSGGADDGLAMLDVLRDWRLQGFADTPPILGYVKVDHTNLTHVKQAIWLFGAVYVGFAFTELSEEQFDAHVPWTPARKTGDGHAVMCPAYFEGGGWASTWGGFAAWTWDWWADCVDECWAVAPAEANDPGFFASGFDHARFMDSLAALG